MPLSAQAYYYAIHTGLLLDCVILWTPITKAWTGNKRLGQLRNTTDTVSSQQL
ncbi:hypothetical protein PAXRUDRAFT_835682 [Paxillus rubicundulus Ve08.2h10]|uniref:Uncharacterized protein n=1 Tax=Paxillus rubicundulus Ve08.2h10 TaxID=930991 RepID=A0A0D0BVM4_9AGAM|nr:hypothetical protein PAXRUDRAFT_835682 [Paxillus rubicundulus Ve08.2h10]